VNNIVKLIMLGLFLLLVLISDIKTRKIKNIIVFPFMAIGILISLNENGIAGFLGSFLGIILPILVMFPLFILRMIGAGDVKCFCSIGAIMSAEFVISSMVYSFITGGVLALIIMAVNKNIVQRFKHFIDYLKSCFLTFSLFQYDNLNTSDGAFRFSFAIALGVSLQLLK